MDHGILFNIFVFLAAACMVVPLASRFMLGSVLGYLAAGIMIGPFGLALIGHPEQIMHFAEFGVVMMLFLIGLELEPPMLWRMRRQIVGLGGLQVTLSALALTGIGTSLGYPWQESAAIGMALALSSTAVVLQMLQEKNLMHTAMGETSFAVLLFQDIAVIPILVLLPLLAMNGIAEPQQGNWITALPGWLHTLIVAGVIGAVIIAGRYLSGHFFHAIARTNLREVFTATSLMLVVGITLLMQFVGVSPALGAFVAGVVLANSEYKHTLETDIEPFKGLLLGLFFISVGMGIDFGLLADEPLALLSIVLVLMTLKALVLFALGRFFGLPLLHNAGFALALCQGGEFAFVLFQFAGGLGIIGDEQRALLTLAVAVSIALTPLLMLLYSRYLMPRFMSVLPDRPYDAVDASNCVILAGYGRFGQIIGRFLMGQGVKVTILEKDPDQIELLRRFGFKGYFGDASRLDLLQNAQADKARILVVTVDNANTCLEIVKMARQHFPQLTIYARARNRRHAYELDRAGVHYFKRETFDSSLAMGEAVMVGLGYKPTEIHQKAQQFREHDEETLKESFQFFENEPDLVSFSRLRAEELERIMQSDVSETEADQEKHYG